MTKHRDFTIEPSEFWYGYEAVHDCYQAEKYGDCPLTGSHPIIHGTDIQDCIEQIDDWYEENEDD